MSVRLKLILSFKKKKKKAELTALPCISRIEKYFQNRKVNYKLALEWILKVYLSGGNHEGSEGKE